MSEQMNGINSVTIRVYSIIINEKNEVLLTDEFRLGINMTKFPGGGLILGESTIDCLHREAMEEFNQDIEVIEHFYTTDFFVTAFHRADKQLMSIYYRVKFKDEIQFKISEKYFDLPGIIDENQSFRWQPIQSLKAEDITFPIDRHVAMLLKEKYS